jgi:hypothetical protein
MPPRKPRSPFSFTLPSDFKVSDADWEKLQTAYGCVIPEEARWKIIAATRLMLSRAAAEHSARPLSESIEHIERLKEAANDLLTAFTAWGAAEPEPKRKKKRGAEEQQEAEQELEAKQTPKLERAASIHLAEEAIEHELLPLTFDGFHDDLMHFVGACKRAPATLRSIAVPGPRRQAWDAWIRDLKDECDRCGLPTGVRKDDEARTNPSPFVFFVWEFQQLISPGYRRGSTEQALAQDIDRVSGP